MNPERGVVPILCYHAIGDDLPSRELPFAFSPDTFEQHLDVIERLGQRTITIADLVQARAHGDTERTRGCVAITFDDGYADLLHVAQPALAARGMVATAFVTTSYVDARSAGDPDNERWLRWDEVGTLAASGTFEIGAHSHDHLELDVLDPAASTDQAARCREKLAREAGVDATSFAYPYGYSNPALRAALPTVGYTAACAVKHALSSADDDPFDLARVRVLRRHSVDTVERWISGEDLRVAPCRTELRTQVFGVVRRARHAVRSGRIARRR